MILDKNRTVMIKEAIVKTVAYFDMFDFPPTAYEIGQYLSVKSELSEIIAILNEGTLKIENKQGFYFLTGREETVVERMNRYNYTNRKIKKAVWLIKIFKIIPWIKMVAVGNIIGANNLNNEGDIDLFIITKDRKIWLTRFFCVILTMTLGLRPKKEKLKDKICLSFYISEKALNLSNLLLDFNDLYFLFWLVGLNPIYQDGDIYRRLIAANYWLSIKLPNWQPPEISQRRKVKARSVLFYEDMVDMLIGGLEKQFKALQLRFLNPDLKDLMNKNTTVVVTDDIIKLHSNDRRQYFKDSYNQKLKNL